MVVYPCDIHKVSKPLTGKKGQLKKEVPSVAMMTNFGFGPPVVPQYPKNIDDEMYRVSLKKYNILSNFFL